MATEPPLAGSPCAVLRADAQAYEREFGAFAKLDNSCQKIVITNDDIDYSTSTVRHIRFRDFVQMEEL